ncbi:MULTISPECIES: hypothetical protein [Citrobacter]|uniref:hypothetical protein n=1 Tax=Citrobacter TaxID=544 RepID=UPI000AB92F43|nr:MULTISPECIES: hypothetical protein [Citrobacter]MDM3001493.1 hypothetical protein [Citrobacter sp. CK192]MDM3022958.1 hypothetical protein [Citrobacter sp. CK193]MDU4402344.1 hypothetical protein [Citrobacter koseri]QJI78163.1 hypothetical protein HH197_07705 [Citrobacter koseri]
MHHIYRVQDTQVANFRLEAHKHHPALSIHLISTGTSINAGKFFNSNIEVFVAISDTQTLGALNSDLMLNAATKNSFTPLGSAEFYI